VPQVSTDGSVGHEQALSDPPVRQTLRREPGDLQLLWGEGVLPGTPWVGTLLDRGAFPRGPQRRGALASLALRWRRNQEP
jgi:hypothetical protein